jgi:hypothetical protein
LEISKACSPPVQPAIRKADREHPWFPIYQAHRSSMAAQLVEAPSFEDWKYQRERMLREETIVRHPRFKEFQTWMMENKGGARPCPAGVFPNNFLFWLDGGRW